MKKIFVAITFMILATGYSSSVLAMNFSIGYKVNDSGDSLPHSFSMTGNIEMGDYEKLLKFIRANPYDAFLGFGVTYVQSNGGDLVEAIKIGKLLKSLRGTVFTQRCISACFFIYIMAPTHYLDIRKDHAVLGVHRPYFDKERFSKLSTKQAETKYEEMEQNARKILVSYKVSQNLIDKMFSVSSSDVYYLSQAEVRQLGNDHPAFDELVIAKCGDAKTTDREIIATWYKCKGKIGYREAVDGMNTVMKGIRNPKWEDFNQGFAKLVAKGDY